MVSLAFMFYVIVGLTAVVGAFRGWAKELVVFFSVILGLFIIFVMKENFPFYTNFIAENPENEFWANSLILLAIAFFGYETPRRMAMLAERSVRDRFQDVVLGFLFGGVNGYFLFGSVWYYLDKAGYFFDAIIAPTDVEVLNLMERLPPAFMLTSPVILVFIAIAFLLVIVVYV